MAVGVSNTDTKVCGRLRNSHKINTSGVPCPYVMPQLILYQSKHNVMKNKSYHCIEYDIEKDVQIQFQKSFPKTFEKCRQLQQTSLQ